MPILGFLSIRFHSISLDLYFYKSDFTILGITHGHLKNPITASIAAPTTPITEPTNVIAPPVNGTIEGDAAPVDMVIAPVPLAALTSDADAVMDGAEVDPIIELIDAVILDVTAMDVVPTVVVLGVAVAIVVDTGAAAVEVEIGAADVAVAAHEHTEATAVMTCTPVAAPQAESTQPSAEAWIAAEEVHWQW
ncbi:hypothetical protein MMC26_003619 [Xylographa opegraphella]|nr:hypothetical protein [Xylographa opegraphella]